MDTELGLVIQGGGLLLDRAGAPVDQCMPPRSYHLPLFCPPFARLMLCLFNAVLLPCGSLDVPDLECTAGIALVFLLVKK